MRVPEPDNIVLTENQTHSPSSYLSPERRRVMSPMPPTMNPGTKKDQPQGELGVAVAQKR